MDLSSLAILACPVGMGLMMWMMMRGNSHTTAEQRGPAASMVGSAPSVEPMGVERPASSRMLRIAGMCFDWRVIAGLAAVGLAVWVLAPGLIAGALPLLLVAACPISMLLMMRGRGRPQAPASTTAASIPTDARLAQLQAELHIARGREAQLTDEISELERETAAVSQGTSANGHGQVR